MPRLEENISCVQISAAKIGVIRAQGKVNRSSSKSTGNFPCCISSIPSSGDAKKEKNHLHVVFAGTFKSANCSETPRNIGKRRNFVKKLFTIHIALSRYLTACHVKGQRRQKTSQGKKSLLLRRMFRTARNYHDTDRVSCDRGNATLTVKVCTDS